MLLIIIIAEHTTDGSNTQKEEVPNNQKTERPPQTPSKGQPNRKPEKLRLKGFSKHIYAGHVLPLIVFLRHEAKLSAVFKLSTLPSQSEVMGSSPLYMTFRGTVAT